MEINSNVTVKSEMKSYDTDFEVKNIRSDNIERDERIFIKVKKEIVKNEEQEVEISEDTLPSSYHYLYPNLKIKEELNDKDLYTRKQIKTESQHNDLCSNDDQSVEEFPENCNVDKKVDISDVTLLSTEYNHNLIFDIEDEKPRIFELQQSSSDHLQQQEEINNDSNKLFCDFCGKLFSAKITLDDHVLQKHSDRTNSIKSKIHTCTICSYQTASKYNLKRHIDSIHNEQKIKIRCTFCDKSFSTNRIRDNHVLKNHKDKINLINRKIHACTFCPYQTTSSFYLNRHMNLIHNKQKIHGNFCGKSFSVKRTRDDHLLKNHKDKTSLLKSKIHTCTICSYQTLFKSKLNKHIDSIHNKQKINCDFCNKSFTKKRIRDDHVLRNHEDKISGIKSKIYSCTNCLYKTTSNFYLKRHINLIHNKQKIHCNFCGKSFSAKRIRDDHVLNKHRDKTSIIKSTMLIHNKQNRNSDFCDKPFTKKRICDDHVLKTHKDKMSLIKSKIHTCTICLYETLFKSKLTRHIDLIHNKQKINCNFCDKSFTTKYIRDDHVLTKHKDKTGLIKSEIHTCTICLYQTLFKSKLNRHIDLRHNKQKKKCHFCDKSFTTRKTRDDHLLKIHKDKTGLIKSESHTCTMCPYQTSFKSNLNRHIRLIHNIQRINCDFCDNSFSTKIICDNHVLKNHKDKTTLIKSKIHTCTVCPYQTTVLHHLNKHINLVHNKHKINCDFCDKSFSETVILDDHVLKKHKDKFTLIKSKIHSCTICSFQTTFNSKLNMHIDSIHNKQKINCDFCDKSFCTKIIRDEHVLNNHKDNISLITRKIHTCNICSFQTTFKAKLNKHIDSVHVETKNKM